MPVVRRYQRQTSIASLPGVRTQAAETALSEGAGVAQAKGEASLAAAGFAGRIAQFGAGAFARIQDEARKKADETVLLASSNAFHAAKVREVYDAKTGALNVEGKDAPGAADRARVNLAKAWAEIEQGYHTDEQRAAGARMKTQETQEIDLQLARHESSEQDKLYEGEVKARLDNIGQEVVANAHFPDTARRKRTEALSLLDQYGARHGWGADETQAAKFAWVSQQHVDTINKLLGAGEDVNAQTYFDREAGKGAEIDKSQIDQVTSNLTASSTAAEGLRAADAIWLQHGPPAANDTAPISLDVMETAARERFKDDPKTLAATIGYLRERKAGVDAGRQDRLDGVVGTLYLAASNRVSLEYIQRMPEYLAAPPKVKAQVTEHVVALAQQAANQAYYDSARRDADEGRADRALNKAQDAAYWTYTDPAKLAAMSENQILALMPTLGREHVDNLMRQYRTIGKSEDTLRSAVIDDELFKSLAERADLHPFATGSASTEASRSALGSLKNQVEAAIDQEQRGTGKALTRERKAAIMQGLIDQKVMLDDYGFDTRAVAAMVNATDARTAYVPIAEIPPQNLREAINYLRSTHADLQRLTDAQIQAQHARVIERAYAAKVLKLGIEEEKRRLGGGD